MASDEVARWLYEGALALSEGRRAAALELLMKVVERDEGNEEGWLWLSGAVEDPQDQRVALENVLLINPGNAAARAGLELLGVEAAPPAEAPATGVAVAGPWVPPPPYDENDVVEIACWQCGATLYSVAPFCWQCHAPVHSCNNCEFRGDARCKPLQGLSSSIAQTARNDCPWWHPVPRA